jgi:pimeloyl-ACP methyl ester carboxylesterase
MRRLLRGFLKVVKWVGLVLLVAVAGVAIWARVARRADAKVPARGRLVDIEPGRRLHLICLGEGQPTVVLEAGLGDHGWSSWSTVQPEISRVTRTCSYDRAATGWSDPPRVDPMPSAMVDDLRALLAAAGEPGPWVLVGHSLGGPIVRHFARRFPGEVAGLVIVDGSHEDQLTRLPKLPATAELLIKAMPVVHALGFDRLVAALADSAAGADIARQSSDQAIANTLWLYNHLDGFMRQARDSGTALGDVPLTVLTAGSMAGAGLAPEQERAFHDAWVQLNKEIAAYSTRSTQQTVPNSTHYIQKDQPAVVVEAVSAMIRAVRDSGAGRGVR